MRESEQSRWARTFAEQNARPLLMLGFGPTNEIIICLTEEDPNLSLQIVRALLKTAIKLIDEGAVETVKL